MGATMPTPVARLTEKDLEDLRVIKERSAVIEEDRTGHRSDGKSHADVFRDGIERDLAEIAAVWTSRHEALLRARRSGRGRVGVLLAAAREQGFGPATPQAAKVAKAMELHDAGVTDAEIGDLFGLSRQRMSKLRRQAGAADSAKIAEVLRLHRDGVPDSEIAKRVGESRQQVGSWRRSAAVKDAGSEDRLGRARSRSKSAAPVRHATPVAAKFKAPAS